MKPTFIFFGGVGWCGTTSLYYTLRNCHYLHGGHGKENQILFKIQEWYDWGFINPKIYFNDFKLFPPNDVGFPDKNRRADPVWIECIDKIPISIKEKILEDLPSLDTYVNYYRSLSEISQNDFKSVGDFSNANSFLRKENLIKFKEALSEYFNIKSIIILRDPIRRIFSNLNSMMYFGPNNRDLEEQSKFIKNEGYNNVTDYFNNSFLKRNKFPICTRYHDLIRRYQNIFGKENVHYIIMEDFFKEERNESVAQFENFIEYKLDKIYPCAFVPDRGINALKIEGLQDQWDSDHEILTEETYMNAREKLSSVYDNFINLHGYLPADWGKPIDYGY